MRIQLIAPGTRMPAWLKTGFDEYAKRMPADCALQLQELALANRPKKYSAAAAERAKQDEGERILQKAGAAATLIALDERGKSWSSRQLAQQLQAWRLEGDVAIVIGGPDGLSNEVKQQARSLWSLSPLTLPHYLVRPIVAEALYRAWSLQAGHPYHRD